MRLFWKQFIAMITLLLISFTIFGVIFLEQFFRSGIEREKEQSVKDLQMYQYTLGTSIENLPYNYQAINLAISDIASNIQGNLGSDCTFITIYDEHFNVLYESGDCSLTLADKIDSNHSGVWKIVEYEDSHYLESLVTVNFGSISLYLQMDRNIERTYESRDHLYETYKVVLIFVFILALFLVAILSARLTTPIKRLSHATREFASGDYGRRVTIQGRDEISDLMSSFNIMADQLEQNMEELQEAARKQEEFTGSFAHELKTPLTSIIGYSQMLSSMELSMEEQQTCSDYIYRQGRRLENLSHKMLELTGIAKSTPSLMPVNIQELFSRVKRITDLSLKKKNITLTLNIEEAFIYGDMELLESLFINLIDNASKASTPDSTISVDATSDSTLCHISVRDNGCGIPTKELIKVREAFYMVDKSRSRKEGGAGIGLALCDKIINLHNATLDIKSCVGKGTTVYTIFPLANYLPQESTQEDSEL